MAHSILSKAVIFAAGAGAGGLPTLALPHGASLSRVEKLELLTAMALRRGRYNDATVADARAAIATANKMWRSARSKAEPLPIDVVAAVADIKTPIAKCDAYGILVGAVARHYRRRVEVARAEMVHFLESLSVSKNAGGVSRVDVEKLEVNAKIKNLTQRPGARRGTKPKMPVDDRSR